MNKLKWTTVQRKVKDLVPLDYNPRKLSDDKKEQLLASLEKFNLVEIPVINVDNTLVAGNQRVYVLMDCGRGEELIDVRMRNGAPTETEIKEYNITSNTHVGIWDVDMLEKVFSDVDLESLGVNSGEIEALKKKDDLNLEVEEDEYDDTLPIVPVSKKGDLYELKNLSTGITHRVHCGDSTSMEDFTRLMNGKKADLVLSDPPYNVNYEGQKGMTIQNDSMSSDKFLQFLSHAFGIMYVFTKPGGCIYIAHSESEGVNFRVAFEKAGFLMKQCLIWCKQSAVLSRQDYNWQHEPILYGWKPGAAHYFIGDFTETTIIDESANIYQMKKDELLELVEKLLANKNESVIKIKRPTKSELHPTMKPVPLIAKLIINSSRRKEIVVDSFLGSGTTLMASEQTGRICYGQELDGRYCDVNIRRWVTYMEKNYPGSFEVLLNGKPISKSKLKKLCLKK